MQSFVTVVMKSSSIFNPRLITLPSDLLVAQQSKNALELLYKSVELWRWELLFMYKVFN